MVTVAEMFTNNDLALRPIHIAAPDAAIRWVATSELPDPTPFFQGGEILLTTGLQTVGWTAQWKAYVEALAKSGTVAMGLATGLTYDQSPRELIDACRSAGFNLFEVPRRTPFVAVSHRVSRLLADEEEAGAREALAVQRKLTAAAAKPDGARAVLPVLAQALRGSAAVVSADGNVQLDAVGQRRGDLVVAELVPELRRLRQQGRRAATTLSSPSGTTVLQPIGVGGRPSSFLAVLGPASLSDSQRNAINTTVALLSLIAEQGRNAAETRRRLRAHAIDLVIAGDVRTAQLVLDVDSRAPTLPASMRFLRATAGAGHLDDALEFLEARNLLSARHDGELWVVMDGEVAGGPRCRTRRDRTSCRYRQSRVYLRCVQQSSSSRTCSHTGSLDGTCGGLGASASTGTVGAHRCRDRTAVRRLLPW